MSNTLYLNEKQKAFLTARQPTKVALMGRGTGKTAVIGPDTFQKARLMPRSKGFFASTTYNQILTKTLPEVEKLWQMCGLREWISPGEPGHYVVGRRPPKHFATPIVRPRKYQNIVTFFNGFTIEFLSTDRRDLIRGGSYDWGYIDEAALVAKKAWTEVLLPTIRGNVHRFGHCWAHQQVAFLTSVPWKAKGQWILEFEQKAIEEPGSYAWIEGTAFDNIHILGERGLERLRREMTELEYRIEVMNERRIKIPDGFYQALDLNIHSYHPKYRYTEGPRGIAATGLTKEYDPGRPIDISFDFGGWFTCFTLWQESAGPGGSRVERCFDIGYVKEDEKLNVLIDRFCKKYAEHKYKLLHIYGEPRGFDRNATGDNIYNQLVEQLNRRGWQAQIMIRAGYQAKEHAWRHQFINEVLEETRAGWPRVRINEEDARDLLFALQIAPITPDLKKDKSREKQRDFPQEHATHLTDTFDYFLTQKYAALFSESGGASRGWTSF